MYAKGNPSKGQKDHKLYLGVTVHNQMETRSTVSHLFSKDVFKHIFYSVLHGAVVAVPFCMALLVCVHCLAYAAIYRFFRTHTRKNHLLHNILSLNKSHSPELVLAADASATEPW